MQLTTKVVFLCDVVGFSKKPHGELVTTIEKIWQVALRDEWIVSMGNRIEFLGTGDGFFAVLSHKSELEAKGLFEFAKRFIEQLTNENIVMRCALHAGVVSPVDMSDFGRDELTGEGLNVCARAVEYADGGQVLVTGDYLNSLGQVGRAVRLSLVPHRESSALSIRVKHGQRIEARFDTANRSIKIHAQELFEQKVKAALVEYLETVRLALTGLVKNRSIKYRMTVFLPDADEAGSRVLACSRFRYGNVSPFLLEPSNTIYGVSENTPVGLGAAYLTGLPVVLTQLPNPEEEFEDYVQAASSGWGCPEEHVRKWDHKARSFIGIPIQLANLDRATFRNEREYHSGLSIVRVGAICLDVSDAFEDVDREALGNLARDLTSWSTNVLAPLLKLYQQS